MSSGLRPIKMPSAKDQVVTQLRKAILSRSMKEGEALALENIASQLNVSVTPVREAFQILARDGLIELRRNKGAVVLGVTETYIREHYQLRAILESAAAEICASPDTDLSEIINVYEMAKEKLAENDFTQYSYYNHAFHSEIWEATGNSKMKKMLSELWNGLSMGDMVTESDYARISLKEHKEILDAIEERNGAKARELMYQHIMRSRDDMLTHYK